MTTRSNAGRAPLTVQQERMWFLHELAGSPAALHLPLALTWRGEFRASALRRSLRILARRHGSLRTRLGRDEQGGFQICDRTCDIDLRALEATDGWRERLRAAIAEPFALTRGPLWRAVVVRRGDRRHVLQFVFHHVIADGWSLRSFARDLLAVYDGLTTGTPAHLPAIRASMAELSARQRRWLATDAATRQRRYWRRQLAGGIPMARFAPDRTCPTTPQGTATVARSVLSSGAWDELRAAARGLRVTTFELLLAAWFVLLGRHSGASDLVVGCPAALREGASKHVIGLLLNTLAIHVRLRASEPFRALTQRVARTVRRARANQRLPFEVVLQGLGGERSASRAPFSSFFNMLAFGERSIDRGTYRVTADVDLAVGARFETEVYAEPVARGLALTLVCDASRYGETFGAELLHQYEQLLAAFGTDPEVPTGAPTLVTDAARRVLPIAAAPPAAPEAPSLLRRLLSHARQRPAAAAVADDVATWTYGELEAHSRGLAAALRGAGIGRGDVVAIEARRSATLVPAVLGVMRSGATFWIVDPQAPRAGVARQALQANPRLWLAVDADARRFDGLRERVWVLPPRRGGAWPGPDADGATGPGIDRARGDDVACLVFTSGSTGQPKGVAGSHGGLTAMLRWQRERFALGTADRFSMLSPLAQDPLQRDVFTALWAGATLVVPDAASYGVPGALLRWMHDRSITVANVSPALARLIMTSAADQDAAPVVLADLRCSFFVGEPLTTAIARDWRRLAPRATIVNLYGATETQRALTHWALPPDRSVPDPASGAMPIGSSSSGVDVLVRNGHGSPCGVGELGELHVRSRYLARGYLGDAALTARRFLPDPNGTDPRDRIYRTGDLGRYASDGTITLAGRVDRQVKIRGFRVEPEEVERTLLRLPGIREAAVEVAPGDDDRPTLIAYVAADASTHGDDWRRALESELGSASMPARFVALDSLPRLASGKIDRRALAAQPPRSSARPVGEPPATPTEARLLRIWSDVLEADAVGPDQSFFELGGHSLSAMELLARVRREWCCDLSLRSFLDAPTVRRLAQLLDATARRAGDEAPAAPEPSPASRHEPFPLTDLQRAYWVGRRLEGALGNVASHAYYEIDFQQLDIGRLERAWRRLVERHDMLRAVVGDDGLQRVLPAVEPYRIAVDDVRELGVDAERHLTAVRERMSHRLSDAARWPLFALRVTRLRGDRCRLHLSIDFLVADASSWGVALPELARLYADPDATLPELHFTFRDYVNAIVRGAEPGRQAQDIDYWRQRATSLPEPPRLPAARDVSQIRRPRFRRRSQSLPPEQWRLLKTLAAGRAVTPAALLLTVYAEVLALWAAEPRFTIHVTRFDRRPVHPDVRAIVGDFTSLTLLAVEHDPKATLASRAEALQRQLWQDLSHGSVSGVRVRTMIAEHRGSWSSLAAPPVVFTSKLGLDDPRQRANAWPAAGSLVYGLSQTPQVCLDLQVAERGDGALLCDWDAVDEIFPPGVIDSLSATYRQVLRDLVEPDAWNRTRLAEIPPAQRERRRSANDTAAPPPAGLLHEAFLARARLHPQAVAVAQGDRVLSYGELAARAQAVTRWLESHGAGPGQLVGIVMHKGWEQLAAAIGVLDSGAAYLPIDASQPPRRIAQLLRSGDVALVLTQRPVREEAEWLGAELVACVDELAAHDAPSTVHRRPARPDDLAYVMFTSGSTGEPQGVMIEHRAVRNTVVDIGRRFRIGAADAVFAISSMAFDLSVYDVFGLLGVGGAVVVPDPRDLREPAAWLTMLERHRVTIWNSVPALMQVLVNYMAPRGRKLPESLRLVLLSGDWIPVALPDRIRSLAHDPSLSCVSLGGATEASIWSISHVVGAGSTVSVSIPYGRPLTNQTVHVLDADFEAPPDFKAGELFIGGIGLARGYWKNPAKTAERFVRHPATGERLYRTGDLGRYLPDGDIELLGRTDFQVKIQGFRIELGEVEHVLASHPAVESAIAVAEGERGAGRRLLAYCVPRGPVQPSEDELRTFLRQRLPDHMIPARISCIRSWPLSANGKIDRRALPAPAAASRNSGGGAAIDELQRKIVAVFAAVLQRPAMTVDDGFFEHGGTSLHVVEAHARLARSLGREFPMTALFRHATAASLAGYLGASAGQGSPPPDPVEAARDIAARRRQRPQRRRPE